MPKALEKLNVYYRTAIFSLFIGVLIDLALLVLFFIGYAEIPLGILLGVLFGNIIYIINGIIEDKGKDQKAYRLATAFIFIRLLLLVGFIVGMSYLYYRGNVHTFNVFALAGGYFICEIVFIVLHLKEDR